MIFPRESAMAALREALDDNAATVLLGPRQIGKTTLGFVPEDETRKSGINP